MGRVSYLGLCLLGCLLLNPSVEGANDTVEARFSCPSGAFDFRNICYQYFPESITWDAAEIRCQGLGRGAHLVSLLSPLEERMVSAYLKTKNYNRVWIGLFAAPTSWSKEGLTWEWEWSNGAPYNQFYFRSSWGPSNPISSKCIAYSPSGSPWWMQYDCSTCLPFVCKYRRAYY